MSVAVDLQGASVVRPYADGLHYNTVVDDQNKLAGLFGFTIVPNGIFVDPSGIIRLIKQGFTVSDEKHVEAVVKLIRGDAEFIELEDVNRLEASKADPLRKQLADTKFKLAMEYAQQGRKDEALQQLDEALSFDPDSFLIRKQRWYLRYPEKFNPTIDFEWQKKQLAAEKEEEARMQDCGPDGCELPGQQGAQ